MNKQATALENAAKRADQTNSDSSTMIDSHWYSIAGATAQRRVAQKRKSGDNKEMGLEGRRSGYFSQREPQREAKSGRIHECVLGRRRKRMCKGTEPGKNMVNPHHRLPLPTNQSPQST